MRYVCNRMLPQAAMHTAPGALPVKASQTDEWGIGQ
jgi:hypothetical protein